MTFRDVPRLRTLKRGCISAYRARGKRIQAPGVHGVSATNGCCSVAHAGSDAESAAFEQEQPPARERQQHCRSAANAGEAPPPRRVWSEPFHSRRTRIGCLRRSHQVSNKGRYQIDASALVCATTSLRSGSVGLAAASATIQKWLAPVKSDAWIHALPITRLGKAPR
jgi:hypothetical protein